LLFVALLRAAAEKFKNMMRALGMRTALCALCNAEATLWVLAAFFSTCHNAVPFFYMPMQLHPTQHAQQMPDMSMACVALLPSSIGVVSQLLQRQSPPSCGTLFLPATTHFIVMHFLHLSPH
jgi:hypothetical protein